MGGIIGDSIKLPDQNGYPTFVTNSFNITTALNKCMFQLFNGNTTNRIFIHSLAITNEQNAAVTGVIATYDVARSSALATGSTAQTVIPLDSTQALPASITASNGGTATATVIYDKVVRSTDEWVATTLDAESSTQPLLASQNILQTFSNGRPIVLNLNEGLIVNCFTSTTTGLNSIRCVFSVGA